MAHQTARTGQPLPTASVWISLTAERRAAVLRLLTQLAHTFITMPLRNSQKGENHATPSPDRQGLP
jgi:predicted Fe-S protein YdhL (DUF1289 family)